VSESVCVIGSGRLGAAVLARLEQGGAFVRTGGRDLDCDGATLVLLCVPDRAIAEIATAIRPGPWIAHMSGAVSIAALAPHERRFALHPLQTFQEGLGPSQLDGSWCAITAESEEARSAARDLAALLGLSPFLLSDANRPIYHAAATMAATFLVTLHRAAADLMSAAEAPPEALQPLMRRTIANGFQPTGPFVRGDTGTVALHRQAIGARRPDLLPLYDALAHATETLGPHGSASTLLR
jgi:predicted short-subunit dehydrogenase-like oxidoreductase (DUF2520 family)